MLLFKSGCSVLQRAGPLASTSGSMRVGRSTGGSIWGMGGGGGGMSVELSLKSIACNARLSSRLSCNTQRRKSAVAADEAAASANGCASRKAIAVLG